MTKRSALAVAVALAVLTGCGVSMGDEAPAKRRTGSGSSSPTTTSPAPDAEAQDTHESALGTRVPRPTVEWSRDLPEVMAIAGDPNGEELVAVSPGSVTSLAASEGTTRWTQPVPIQAGDEVEITVFDKRVAINSRPAGSGDDAWSVWVFDAEEERLVTSATDGWRLGGLREPPSSADPPSIILERPIDSAVRVLDGDGEPQWETSDETYLHTRCDAVLTRADGRIVAREGTTGQLLWRGGPETKDLGVLGCSGYDVVATTEEQGEFLRIDSKTGAVKNRVDLDAGGRALLVSTTTGILAFAEDEPSTPGQDRTPYRAMFFETYSTVDGDVRTGDDTVRWTREPGCSMPADRTKVDRIDSDYAAVQLSGELCNDRLVLLDMYDPYLSKAISAPESHAITTDDDDDHIVGWPAPDDDDGELFSVGAFDLEPEWSYPADEVDTGFVGDGRVFIIDGAQIRSLTWV